MRRIWIAIVLGCTAFAGLALAQESVTLTTPASVGTRNGWSLNYWHIDFQPSIRIVVEAQDNLGNVIRDEHSATTTPTGATVFNTLNTANFAAATCPGTPADKCSFVARLFKHLQAEGKIGAGTVTGTPQ